MRPPELHERGFARGLFHVLLNPVAQLRVLARERGILHVADVGDFQGRESEMSARTLGDSLVHGRACRRAPSPFGACRRIASSHALIGPPIGGAFIPFASSTGLGCGVKWYRGVPPLVKRREIGCVGHGRRNPRRCSVGMPSNSSVETLDELLAPRGRGCRAFRALGSLRPASIVR